MRLILAIVATAGLLVAAAPADASPPGTFYLASGGSLQLVVGTCHATYYHGNFGNIAYSRWTSNSPGCAPITTVQALAWGDASPICNTFLAQSGQYPDCVLANNGATVQATATGTLIESSWNLCQLPQTCTGVIRFSPFP